MCWWDQSRNKDSDILSEKNALVFYCENCPLQLSYRRYTNSGRKGLLCFVYIAKLPYHLQNVLVLLIRLKSEESLLYKVLKGIGSHHRLLLTGKFCCFNRVLVSSICSISLAGLYIMQNTMVVGGGGMVAGEKKWKWIVSGKKLKRERKREENHMQKRGKRP